MSSLGRGLSMRRGLAAVLTASCFLAFLIYRLIHTYERLTRFAHLSQLQSTLSTAPNVLWIIVEDASSPDPAILALLETPPLIPHLYIHTRTVPVNGTQHRGVAQRNAALDVIRENAIVGVVYFADDDNAYTPTLFKEISKLPTHSYTIFPVGNTGYFGFEGPIVGTGESEGELKYWCCDYCVRRWNVDMAGLAFHTSLLRAVPDLALSFDSTSGSLESNFLSTIESANATLYLLPDLMRQVRVWHDAGTSFAGAAYYISNWETGWIDEHGPTSNREVVKGFTPASPTLPRAIYLRT
ncbi:hypothetical protein P7C70_g2425, partial [Phenoliferia sp. Uapishka_3]